MVYIVNVFLICFWGICISFIAKIDKKKLFLVISVIQMSLIVGLRYKVGADYLTYEKMFYSFGTGENILKGYLRVEAGYQVLNWTFYNLNIPFWGLCLFIAFITHFFLAKAVYNWCLTYKETFLAIYLYISLFFFYHSMNMMRQGAAMTIGLYALTCLTSNKKRKYLIFILISSIFHSITAIVFLSFFLLKDIEINKKTIMLYFGTAVFLVVGYEYISRIALYTKYAVYLGEYYNKSGLLSSYANLIVRILMMAIFIILGKYMEQNKKRNILFNMIILCTIFQIVTIRTSVFARITTPLFLAYIILIPCAIRELHSRYKNFLWLVGLIVATLYQIVYYSIMKTSVLVNSYQSILSTI